MRNKLLLYVIARVAGGFREHDISVIRFPQGNRILFAREKETRESELACIPDGIRQQFIFGGKNVIIFPQGNKMLYREEIRERRSRLLANLLAVHVSVAMTEALTSRGKSFQLLNLLVL